jgi:hypothetical protein
VSAGKNSVVGIAIGVLLARLAGKTVTGTAKLVRRLLFRWRRILTPLWCGFGLWLFAVLYRWLIRDWWPMVLLIGGTGLTLALFGPRLSERIQAVVSRVVPDGLDRGRTGVLDSFRERVYLGTLLTYVSGYLALRIAGGSTDLTERTWQIGVLVFGGIWWWHRRIRTIGRADKYLRSWRKLSEGKTSAIELRPLVGSKPVESSGTRGVVRIRVKLAEGMTAAHVAKASAALASFWDLRPGAVFVSEHERNSRWAWLTLLPRDPWKGKITHPMPAVASTTLVGLNYRFEMGLHADGRPSYYRLQHTLLVGASGMGKSAWIESLMIWLLDCQDVAIAGIDMASGATLGIWRRVLALPLATDIAEAIGLLKRVLALIEDRERQLAVGKEEDEDDIDSFQPTKDTPWLVLIIDEFPDLVAGGEPKEQKLVLVLLSRIAKRARKAGVKLIFACQNGSKADLGAKEIQSQLTCVVSLGLDPHASRTLWVSLWQNGWRSENLKVGQYFLRDPEHTQPDIAKGYFVPTSERRAAVKAAADRRPQFEPSAWLALNSDTGYTPEEETPRPEPVPEPPSDPVLAAIVEKPRTGQEIADLLGPSPSRATVFRRLQAFKEAGQAYSINGVWYPGSAIEGESEVA